jgi:geranyl-CoA carboxylase alpha subunit
MNTLRTILVANRGEIAVRVMRTAKALGYRTVAVYSDADRHAPHVRLADTAVRLGPAPLAESYLDAERILQAAALAGADAIHPGYGFLSENAAFARAVQAAGRVFIGPGSEAIALMGNKAAAKRRMLAAGVPCVPGYEGEDQSDAAFTREAARIGYPVMVKAAAGGGGRGMRLVREAAELPAALGIARAEAASAFGSEELILEKAIERPRHVEIQVFADAHGHVIHLGERDCSVQRRHQKVIEESPCPVMSPALRERMGAAAVEAARSIGYRGAGTVEFLLAQDGSFHFLEMNTRLQVEHPVTEMITGLDLVALQIRVAEGLPLGIAQAEVRLDGHAIEARLYAEDPAAGFLPASGTLLAWQPAEGEGLRTDAGVASGQEISPFYDPMLAKIIAWGPDRATACRRLRDALERTVAFGPATNRGFLVELLGRERFLAGEATTAFIGEEFGAGAPALVPPGGWEVAAGAVLEFVVDRERACAQAPSFDEELLDWHSGSGLGTPYRYADGEAIFDLHVEACGAGRYTVRAAKASIEVVLESRDATWAVLRIDGTRRAVAWHRAADGTLHLASDGRDLRLQNLLARSAAREDEAAGGRVAAPMHGVIVACEVSVGQAVRRGTRIAVLEAMKMQHALLAPLDGVVAAVGARVGAQVAAGDLLVHIEAAAVEGTSPG